MVICAMNMLLAQLMGLHFHRHVGVDDAGHGTSLQLRDAGIHLHGADDSHHRSDHHHSSADRASHPDADLEIDPLGASVAKFSKVWLNAAVLLVAMLCLFAVVGAVPSSRALLPAAALPCATSEAIARLMVSRPRCMGA